MRRLRLWCVSSAVLWLMAGSAFAQTSPGASNPCKATASAPTYAEGSKQPLSCDLAGTLRTTAGGSGGAGDASAANQLTEISKLTSIDGKLTSGVPVTGTFWQATQPVSGTFWQATQPVSVASVPTHAVTQSGTWNIGSVTTLPATPAGSNLIGQVAPVGTATTTNAASTCYLTSAATTNSTNCKSSAGNVYGYMVINTTATLYYLRMYNASAAPTCSSATNFVNTIPVPASATGAGISHMIPVGQAFATGIGFCLTGGGSSTDNTNAATGVYITILYK